MNEKLKTLKDMERKCGYSQDLIDRGELKAEAIKWVRENESDKPIGWMIAEWIKHFFNITEEDLKDE